MPAATALFDLPMTGNLPPSAIMVPVRFRPLAASLLLCVLWVLPGPGRAYAPGDALRGPPAPVRYGLLWLQVEPSDARVALNGEFLDRGVWLISMAPGRHEVSVRREGFRPWVRQIGIGPGESLKIAVHLEKDASGPGNSAAE